MDTHEETSGSVETPVSDSPAPDTGSTADSSSRAPTRSTVEATIAKRLAEFRKSEEGSRAVETEPEPETPGASEETESTSVDDSEVKEQSPSTDAATEVEDESKEGETENQPSKPKAKTPTVPSAYRRSLQAYGWTDEEINEFAAANPVGFLTAAQKIHQNRTAEIAQWAAIGRQQQQQTQQPVQENQPKSSAIDPSTGMVRPIDADSMVEKYGNEELVRELTGPINEVIKQINSVLPSVMHGAQAINEARQQSLNTQIEQFFGGEELKPFAELYGKAGSSMSEDQQRKRIQVLETADALIAGAKYQGRKLSVPDALLLAHDSVSGDFKAAAVRKELKQKVVVRNKGLSIKPASSTPQNGPPKNRSELERKVSAKLASLFN